jgi:hypothetical protein
MMLLEVEAAELAAPAEPVEVEVEVEVEMKRAGTMNRFSPGTVIYFCLSYPYLSLSCF